MPNELFLIAWLVAMSIIANKPADADIMLDADDIQEHAKFDITDEEANTIRLSENFNNNNGDYDNDDEDDDDDVNLIGDAGLGYKVDVIRQRPKTWRMCYVCSGSFPDRECELYPENVNYGPKTYNCSGRPCAVYARFRVNPYLVKRDYDGDVVGTERPITPYDYEVESIARECGDMPRGTGCHIDLDRMGMTCYDTCSGDLCNRGVPGPPTDGISTTPLVYPHYYSTTPPAGESDHDYGVMNDGRGPSPSDSGSNDNRRSVEVKPKLETETDNDDNYEIYDSGRDFGDSVNAENKLESFDTDTTTPPLSHGNGTTVSTTTPGGNTTDKPTSTFDYGNGNELFGEQRNNAPVSTRIRLAFVCLILLRYAL